MLIHTCCTLIFALFILFEVEAQDEGEPCETIKGVPGVCRGIDRCPSVYKKLLNGEPPDGLCELTAQFQYIVCCPGVDGAPTNAKKPASASSTPSASTLETTIAPLFADDFELVDRINDDEPGDLAERKCAEYSKSTWTLVIPPTLEIDPEPVYKSLCPFNATKLIIGGKKAEPKEFPHMAAVGYNPRLEGIRWSCGGTLVSEKFVLTAAHCAYSTDYGPAVRVRVGDLNLVRTDDNSMPQERQIIERLRHPLFNKPSVYHDIALLRMDKPVIFDAYTRPACLPTSSHSEGSAAITTGWGIIDEYDEEGSEDLLKVTVKTVDQRTCNASKISFDNVHTALNRGIIDDLMICAGGLGKDACQGDSGGPLVIYDLKHSCMYNVVGITSFGQQCGSTSYGVYTRVYNYMTWLESTIWSEQ